MRRIVALFLCFVLLFTFSGCKTADENTPAFSEWLETNHQELYDNGKLVFGSLGNLGAPNIDKEDAEYTPNVVLSIPMRGDAAIENILYKSPTTLKEELRELCNYLFEYADYCQWYNDYHLYVSSDYYFGVGYYITYDYETDELILPNSEIIGLLQEAFDRFRTLDEEKIAQVDGGIDWMLDNDIGYMKHNKFEFTGWDVTDSGTYYGRWGVGLQCRIYNNKLDLISHSNVERY